MNFSRFHLFSGLPRYDETFFGILWSTLEIRTSWPTHCCRLDHSALFTASFTSYLSGTNTMILFSWKAEETDDFRLSSSWSNIPTFFCIVGWMIAMKSKMVAESGKKPTAFTECSFTSNSCSSLLFGDFLCSLVEWEIEKGTHENSYESRLLKSTVLVLLTARSLEERLCWALKAMFRGFLDYFQGFFCCRKCLQL